MKRMLKKLAAIALAGAMVLSLSVTALAAEPTISGMGAQGSASGQVESQGRIPEDVISVRMPLSADGTFNMYVDPHNLIRESQNAMQIGGSDASVELFAEDTLVYFANKSEDGAITGFSKTSDPIKVTNMSNVPVNIDMEATWKMGNGNSYELAKNATDFAAAKTAGKASMYLTLDDTYGNSAAVVKADKGVPHLTFAPVEGATAALANTTTEETNYLAKYVKSVEFAFTDKAEADDVKRLNEGGILYGSNNSETQKSPTNWKFTFTKADKKTPSVTFDVGQLPTYPTLTTGSSQTLKKDNAYKITYAASGSTSTTATSPVGVAITDTLNIDGSHTYTVPNGEAKTMINIVKGSDIIATITFDWDYEAIGANSYNITQTVKTGDNEQKTYDLTWTSDSVKSVTARSGEGAYLSNDVNYTEGSYKLDKVNNALEWVFSDGFSADEVDKFQSVSFSLTGAITDGDTCAAAWDDAFSADENSELHLLWKVNKCDAVDPSATVTSAIESASGAAELNVDWGYGDKKASSITGVSFTTSAGQTQNATFAVDGTTLTVNSSSALYSGAAGVVTITFNTGKTFKVDLTKAVSSS